MPLVRYNATVTELIVPVAFGLIGGGLGYVATRQRRKHQWQALSQSDALRAEGRYKEAISLLEQWLRIAPNGPDSRTFSLEAHYRLAGLYATLGNWPQVELVASELLGSANSFGLSGKHDVLMHRAKARAALGREAEASADRAAADALIEEIPDTAYRLYARQERLVRIGSYSEALLLQNELLAGYQERLGSVPTLLVSTAATAFNLSYFDEALQRTQEALKHPKTNPTIQREASRIGFRACEALADWGQMLRFAEADLAARKSENDPAQLAIARENLAIARTCVGDLSGALELTNPQKVSLALLRSDIFCLLGRFDLATEALADWTAPTEWDRLAMRASVALKANDGKSALEALNQQLPNDRTAERFLIRRAARRAHALALISKKREAKLELKSLAALDADGLDRTTRWLVLEHTARAHQTLGDYAEAITAFDALLTEPIAPVFRPGILNAMGDCYLAADKTINARAAWSEAARSSVEGSAVPIAQERLENQERLEKITENS
jgi:tetratricopeptide (TPR) repeat protein